MWKVSDVEPVRVMGAEGYPYGFNVTTEDGKPIVSFAYASRALAEAGATHLESALLNAFRFVPSRNKRASERKVSTCNNVFSRWRPHLLPPRLFSSPALCTRSPPRTRRLSRSL